jgi:hypothetical protein
MTTTVSDNSALAAREIGSGIKNSILESTSTRRKAVSATVASGLMFLSAAAMGQSAANFDGVYTGTIQVVSHGIYQQCRPYPTVATNPVTITNGQISWSKSGGPVSLGVKSNFNGDYSGSVDANGNLVLRSSEIRYNGTISNGHLHMYFSSMSANCVAEVDMIRTAPASTATTPSH